MFRKFYASLEQIKAILVTGRLCVGIISAFPAIWIPALGIAPFCPLELAILFRGAGPGAFKIGIRIAINVPAAMHATDTVNILCAFYALFVIPAT